MVVSDSGVRHLSWRALLRTEEVGDEIVSIPFGIGLLLDGLL